MRHTNKVMTHWLLIITSALSLMLTPVWAADESLVLYLPLDDGQGTTATDASSYGNHGEVVGDAQWVEGHSGMALEIVDGSHVLVPEIPEYDVTSEISLMTWVKNSGTTTWARMIDKSQWQTTGFDLVLTQGGAIPRFEFFVNNTTSLVDASMSISDGEWHFVAATFGNQTLRMYLDGNLENEAGSTGGVDLNPNDWPIMLGAESSSNGGQQFIGTLDDVAIFNRELSEEEILTIFQDGMTLPGLAAMPAPPNKAVDVLRDSVLSWAPGKFAGTHNVYLGSTFEEVDSATVPTAPGLPDSSYDPGRLEFGKTYFWRVDEVNATPDKFVFKGETWFFEVEPHSAPIPGTEISVTASSFNANSLPDFLIDGSGLTGDTHSTATMTGWLSTPTDLEPWLVFEFTEPHLLDKILVWNSNTPMEPFFGLGAKDITLETSMDGETWTVVEGVTSLTKAPGNDFYNTPDNIALNSVVATRVRIKMASHHSAIPVGTGLSEVQFYAIPTRARTPYPADQAVDVLPDVVATWRAGRGASMNKVLVSQEAVPFAVLAMSNTNSIDMSNFDLLLDETYHWQVTEVNENNTPSEWASDVWTLTTANRVMVDDFESYNNLSPDRPFQTWLDGIGYSSDEFFPVAYGGNGTDAAVGHDIWSVASPHFEGEIMEQILTAELSGQSMPLYYSGNSQTDRTFTPAQDWSVAGITTLVCNFNGDKANDAGSLYVTINGKRVNYPNGSALSTGVWTQWNIDLASLGTNLSQINTMTIGIDSTGSGVVYVDQIGLYRDAPEVPVSTDPGTTGLVALWDFENDYADASGSGLTGTPSGVPQFVDSLAGYGSALLLNGQDDYVDLPVGLMSTLTDCTFALWTNFTGQGGNWQRIFDFGSGTNQYVFLSPSNGGGVLLFEVNGPNAGTNLVPAPMQLPTGWHHVAGVVDSTTLEMTLYLDGTVVGQSLTDSVPADLGETTQNWIGRSQFVADPYYSGSVDDFRIYNRALSEGEIRYLAGDQ